MTKLIGTSPNQVPSNADLGTAAYLESNEVLLAKGSKVTAIAKEISNTAKHVFIYDTSNDSDGGAWRKRTQGTSWYNEPLNTKIRGDRKEFPTVALIVTEQLRVTIYDLDDPNVPMWMRFDSGSNVLIGNNVTSLHQSAMMNGLMMTGKNGGSAGFSIVDFIAEDNIGIWRASAGYLYKFRGSVADRNKSKAYNNTYDTSFATIGAQIYSVAMVLESNAVINQKTGLACPTLLAGTDFGLTIIRNWTDRVQKEIWDIYNGSDSYDEVRNIEVQDDIIYWSVDGTQVSYSQRLSDVKSDINYGTYNSAGVTGHTRNMFMTQDHGGRTTSDMPVRVLGRNGSDHLLVTKDAVGSHEPSPDGQFEAGLTIINQNTKTFLNIDAMASNVTTKYNSGYLPGKTILANLASTNPRPLLGTINVVNGDFDTASDFNSWGNQAGGGKAQFSIVSGRAYLNGRTSGGYDQIFQDVTTIPGEDYVFEAEIEPVANYPYYSVFARSGGANVTTYGGEQMHSNQGFNYNKIYKIQVGFTATTDTTRVVIGGNSANGDQGYFNNVNVYPADLSRKRVKETVGRFGDQAIRVTDGGLVPRRPVAPGAELMGYGPCSDGNRLIADANHIRTSNIGVGSYTVCAWIKKDSRTTNTYIMDAIDFYGGGSNSRMYFLIDNSNGFYVSTGGAASNRSIILKDYEWNLVMATRDTNNNVRFGLNGEWYTPTTNPQSNSNVTTDGTRYLTISGYHGTWSYDYSWDSMALFRYSKTGITKEQFRKMYEDEWPMFQPNAKVTLYGDDDNIRALSRDPHTNLLHAGTSHGRSTFKGLTRVDNSENYITASIDAVKGIIAEE